MQRPRRTSEFQDDPGGIKRQSRIQQRYAAAGSTPNNIGVVAACGTGTAKKYSTRQSRIAIPLRASSSERADTNNAYLNAPSSSVRRGVTPQKTPLPKPTANRVLFTVEKQKIGQGVNANSVQLHNDKRWIHEQTQRITEHLLSQSTLGGGINTEFLNRGLRQMSIKQFVAIINYFLGHIWGNRYTVGSNYVDDIINILQKLQYPYPLNKSWLKTPNTQHSFGNVILLFDFLMDFVPTVEEEGAKGMYFDLKEVEDLNASRMNEGLLQIPDVEFQQELLRNSEEGFLLWDKQKTEDFDNLQLHTCNFLIQKLCGVPSLQSVELEIEKLKDTLKSLESEKLPEDREMVKMKLKLTHELKSLRRDIKTLQDEYDNNETNIKEMESRKKVIAEEINSIEIDIKSLQEIVNSQSCTVEQRIQLIEDVTQHKQMLAIKERTIQELRARYHNEQIMHSKTIKLFNEQIESFNAHMREIKFSELMKFDNTLLSEANLELSLRPEQTELEKLLPLLEKISNVALNCIRNNKEELLKIQEHCKQLTSNINNVLHSKLNSLRAVNARNDANLKNLMHTLKEEECKLLNTIKKTEQDLIIAEKAIKELQTLIQNKKVLIDELMHANEQTMQHAEQKHQQCLEQRKSFLKAYEEVLEECLQNDVLQNLIDQVQLQEKQIEELNKDVKL